MACSIYSGKKYTNAEIRVMARQAGWPEALVPIVAAVSLAESGGDPGAMNICGEHSVGLLQVNQRSHNVPTSVLTNPINNLKIAYDIYKVEGTNAWKNSWTRGGWKKYAQGDEAAGVAAAPGGGGGSSSAVNAGYMPSILSTIPGLGWFFEPIPDAQAKYAAATTGSGYKATGQQRYLIATAIIVLVVAFSWGKF